MAIGNYNALSGTYIHCIHFLYCNSMLDTDINTQTDRHRHTLLWHIVCNTRGRQVSFVAHVLFQLCLSTSVSLSPLSASLYFSPSLLLACRLSWVFRLACNVQPRGLWHFIKLRASYSLLSLSLFIFSLTPSVLWVTLTLCCSPSPSRYLTRLSITLKRNENVLKFLVSANVCVCVCVCFHVRACLSLCIMCVCDVCIVYCDRLMMGQWQLGVYMV